METYFVKIGRWQGRWTVLLIYVQVTTSGVYDECNFSNEPNCGIQLTISFLFSGQSTTKLYLTFAASAFWGVKCIFVVKKKTKKGRTMLTSTLNRHRQFASIKGFLFFFCVCWLILHLTFETFPVWFLKYVGAQKMFLSVV